MSRIKTTCACITPESCGVVQPAHADRTAGLWRTYV